MSEDGDDFSFFLPQGIADDATLTSPGQLDARDTSNVGRLGPHTLGVRPDGFETARNPTHTTFASLSGPLMRAPGSYSAFGRQPGVSHGIVSPGGSTSSLPAHAPVFQPQSMMQQYGGYTGYVPQGYGGADYGDEDGNGREVRYRGYRRGYPGTYVGYDPSDGGYYYSSAQYVDDSPPGFGNYGQFPTNGGIRSRVQQPLRGHVSVDPIGPGSGMDTGGYGMSGVGDVRGVPWWQPTPSHGDEGVTAITPPLTQPSTAISGATGLTTQQQTSTKTTHPSGMSWAAAVTGQTQQQQLPSQLSSQPKHEPQDLLPPGHTLKFGFMPSSPAREQDMQGTGTYVVGKKGVSESLDEPSPLLPLFQPPSSSSTTIGSGIPHVRSSGGGGSSGIVTVVPIATTPPRSVVSNTTVTVTGSTGMVTDASPTKPLPTVILKAGGGGGVKGDSKDSVTVVLESQSQSQSQSQPVVTLAQGKVGVQSHGNSVKKGSGPVTATVKANTVNTNIVTTNEPTVTTSVKPPLIQKTVSGDSVGNSKHVVKGKQAVQRGSTASRDDEDVVVVNKEAVTEPVVTEATPVNEPQQPIVTSSPNKLTVPQSQSQGDGKKKGLDRRRAKSGASTTTTPQPTPVQSSPSTPATTPLSTGNNNGNGDASPQDKDRDVKGEVQPQQQQSQQQQSQAKVNNTTAKATQKTVTDTVTSNTNTNTTTTTTAVLNSGPVSAPSKLRHSNADVTNVPPPVTTHKKKKTATEQHPTPLPDATPLPNNNNNNSSSTATLPVSSVEKPAPSQLIVMLMSVMALLWQLPFMPQLQLWFAWLQLWYQHVGLSGIALVTLQQVMCCVIVAIGFCVAGVMSVMVTMWRCHKDAYAVMKKYPMAVFGYAVCLLFSSTLAKHIVPPFQLSVIWHLCIMALLSSAESAWIRFSCVVVVPLHFVHYAFLARFTLSEYNIGEVMLLAYVLLWARNGRMCDSMILAFAAQVLLAFYVIMPAIVTVWVYGLLSFTALALAKSHDSTLLPVM